VVAELCQALSGAGIQVWTDWRRLSPGDDLNDNIRRAIDEARHVVAVLSTNALNSKWVADELRYALSVRDRRGDGFKVVPVLLPGLEPTAVEWLLGDDLVAVRLRTAPGGVQDALPDLLYALGEAEPERAPAAADGAGEVTAAVAELVVELSEPAIEEDAGKRRAVARAGLIYRPA
ncbi:MAG: toll/interleukin-1 receptor domain-containing protein, partial [bacterium]|nr:toll/interleukin-1 receptor domain-containing protein [bacterium]